MEQKKNWVSSQMMSELLLFLLLLFLLMLMSLLLTCKRSWFVRLPRGTSGSPWTRPGLDRPCLTWETNSIQFQNYDLHSHCFHDPLPFQYWKSMTSLTDDQAPDSLKLDESQHGVDAALVVGQLEDAVGDDRVDVRTEKQKWMKFEFFLSFFLSSFLLSFSLSLLHPLPGVGDFLLVALVRGSGDSLLNGFGTAVLVTHLGKGSPVVEE